MADWDYRPEEEQEKEPKEKKYVTRKEFYFCFIILLAVLFFQNIGIKDRIRQAESYVTNTMHSVEGTISSNISSIPRNIEQGIEEANNPIRESGMEIVDVDVKTKTAVIRMTASPKEYVDGMTMKFMVSCDGGEVMEVPAAAGNDRTFAAEMKVPFCDEVKAIVSMRKGNTEYLSELPRVAVNYSVLPMFNGHWSGGVSWQANQDFVTFDGSFEVNVNTPEWIMNQGKEKSFSLKNEKVEVYIDGKKVKTLPAEVVHEDEYTCSYQAQSIEENRIKLKVGKEIEVFFTAEDDNGLHYSYLVEKGTWNQNDGYDNDAVWNMSDQDRLTVE